MIPEGKWSCAYCSYDHSNTNPENYENDVNDNSKLAISEMITLSNLIVPCTTSSSVTNALNYKFDSRMDVITLSKLTTRYLMRQLPPSITVNPSTVVNTTSSERNVDRINTELVNPEHAKYILLYC